MTHVRIPADSFVEEALRGLCLVHADLIRPVDGGVVRREPLPEGHVALVIGGGSGHYPAFAGTVGPGMAAGAVCGQVFTSPSAGQAYRVAQAAQAGGGVLFSFGNYAGDVLHFGQAQDRLRDEGIDCRTVLVTDDVASAPRESRADRRGIAGDHVVFKIAGAAAERGADLDEVERLARLANDQTVSMGAAFSGCTLPGADAPLFEVPDGMISVGLGIHGEPGVRDEPMPDAPGLARILVEPLLAERPEDHGGRVVAILNGLGTVKYEELFVLFAHVHERLAAAGLEVAFAECGELVTSLDMGGVSLTLLWLDDELEPLWAAPAHTPAYQTGGGETGVRGALPVDDATADLATPDAQDQPVADADQRAVAHAAVALMVAARDTIADHADALGDLDAIAGDGDHGTGMLRGLSAAVDAAQAQSGPVDAVLTAAADAWSERAGGTSGALWSAGLQAMATRLGPARDVSGSELAEAARAGVEAVAALGDTQPGDKTMIDAMVPWVSALEEALAAGTAVRDALRLAAAAALQAASDTAELVPQKGRARPLAERSRGHADPGATSFAHIVDALVGQE